MKYSDLITQFGSRPFFETGELNILFDESLGQIRARLSRWVSEGKLLQLRRGKYLLPEMYRRTGVSDGYISNYLYRPSYVSLHTALELYGMIPESVNIIEAVTPRQTAVWRTPVGTFKYFSIKAARFGGYTQYGSDKIKKEEQSSFLVATPEKALIDVFYFLKGQWTVERMVEMRFQNLDSLRVKQLRQHADNMKSPKVSRAVDVFMQASGLEVK